MPSFGSVTVGAVLASTIAAAGQTCVAPGWLPRFAEGAGPQINAVTTFDPDGAGPERRRLVVGGVLTKAGGIPCTRAASWDGVNWQTMDLGIPSSFPISLVKSFTIVRSAATLEEQLFAGGQGNWFARWKGDEWESLPGPGPSSVAIEHLCAHDDDGPGPGVAEVFAVAYQTQMLPEEFALWRWNGTDWNRVAVLPGRPMDLISVSHPSMPGVFILCRNSYFLDGFFVYRYSSGGVQGLAPYSQGSSARQVRSLAFYESPVVGPSLYISGWFNSLAGVSTSGVVRWSGSSWHNASAGIQLSPAMVNDLAVWDPDGPGSQSAVLVAAGSLFSGTTATPSVGAWNGTAWTPVGDALPLLGQLAVLDEEQGVESLFATRGVPVVPDGFGTGVSRLHQGTTWIPVGQAVSGPVFAACAKHDAGGGGGALENGLYVGGWFNTAGSASASNIAHWNGASWSSLDGGVNQPVSALLVGNIGGQPALIAGGGFTSAGSISAANIAGWMGGQWLRLGDGFNARVTSLHMFGGDLIAGGEFVSSGQSAVAHIALWNGMNWVPLGDGANAEVLALATLDETLGTALYAGGAFTSPGSRVAKWSGSGWSPVGAGFNGTVRTLTVHDDGSGPTVFAGGDFSASGGVSVSRVAKWNGLSWTPLGSGLDGPVRALAEIEVRHPGPPRKLLAVGGDFTHAGGVAAPGVAIWYRGVWFNVSGGVDGSVSALCALDPSGSGGARSSLVSGGSFLKSGGMASPHLGEWSGCSACYPNCDASMISPVLTANDFLCFLGKFAAGDPYANCDGSTSLPLLTANDFQCFLHAFSQGCN